VDHQNRHAVTELQFFPLFLRRLTDTGSDGYGGVREQIDAPSRVTGGVGFEGRLVLEVVLRPADPLGEHLPLSGGELQTGGRCLGITDTDVGAVVSEVGHLDAVLAGWGAELGLAPLWVA
jgi:hypothetical protein